MRNLNQRYLIHQFNETHRSKFNPALFTRTDDELIDTLRDIIYSCERDNVFTIKVLDFTVIDNYDDINHILWEYEDYIINKGKKTTNTATIGSKRPTSSKKENQFAYINLKDSALKLIKVTYFIQINEKKNGLVNDTIDVYIAIPRIVDGFYYRLNGNTYSAINQIVDASTYNNSAARNARKQSITFKTIFSPIRVYRYSTNIKDIDGNIIPCKYFIANIFTKPHVLLMKYIFAKTGLAEGMKFLHIEGVSIIDNCDSVNKSDYYIFPARDLYVIAPKIVYDSIQIAQSLVYTLTHTAVYLKDNSIEELYQTETWVKVLGAEFLSKDVDMMYEKGLSILASLEFTYDIPTMKDLHLDMENKADIYRVLRWMMYEFNALRKKDNLDITTKKVRTNYSASLYANRLAFGIYRISDKGDKADLNTIKKALQIPPMYLINAISRCELVNYKDCVNDMDALIKLKYTYKGVSGIGEKSNAVSSSYRSVHPSHLGRVDIDSSSNSDPGITGALCPFAQLYDGHFSEYDEPCSWEADVTKVMDAYNRMLSRVEMCRIVENSGLSLHKDNAVLNECISVARGLVGYSISAMLRVKDIKNYGNDIFGDGYFFETYE